MPDAAVTVAVAQFHATPDVSENLATIERLATTAAAQGARVVICPEASMFAFGASAADIAIAARDSGGAFESAIHALAGRLSIVLVVGLYAPGTARLAQNTFIVAGADGRPLAGTRSSISTMPSTIESPTRTNGRPCATTLRNSAFSTWAGCGSGC